ncbi:MAG TPA: hypothetical protein VM901_07165 [Bdellovibrionota bacterium]|jgi:hypothetical protein|nr:hypothetical protein [Bdellovibrionota bacterium]
MKNKLFWIASLSVISVAMAQEESPEYFDETPVQEAPVEAVPKYRIPKITTITQPTNEVVVNTGDIVVIELSANYRPAEALIRKVEVTDDFYQKTGEIKEYVPFVIVKREADGSFDYNSRATTFLNEVELKPNPKTRQLSYRLEHLSFGPFGHSLISAWDEDIDVRNLTPEQVQKEIQKRWLERAPGTYVWGFGKRVKAFRTNDGEHQLGETITNPEDLKEENFKKGGYDIFTRLAGNGLGTIKVTLSKEDTAAQTELLKTP